MKTLFAVFLLMLSVTAQAQVFAESSVSNTGIVIVRFHNTLPAPVWCYFRDRHNYFTFVIAAGMPSMWYPAYGIYQWQCVIADS